MAKKIKESKIANVGEGVKPAKREEVFDVSSPAPAFEAAPYVAVGGAIRHRCIHCLVAVALGSEPQLVAHLHDEQCKWRKRYEAWKSQTTKWYEERRHTFEPVRVSSREILPIDLSASPNWID